MFHFAEIMQPLSVQTHPPESRADFHWHKRKAHVGARWPGGARSETYSYNEAKQALIVRQYRPA